MLKATRKHLKYAVSAFCAVVFVNSS